MIDWLLPYGWTNWVSVGLIVNWAEFHASNNLGIVLFQKNSIFPIKYCINSWLLVFLWVIAYVPFFLLYMKVISTTFDIVFSRVCFFQSMQCIWSYCFILTYWQILHKFIALIWQIILSLSLLLILFPPGWVFLLPICDRYHLITLDDQLVKIKPVSVSDYSFYRCFKKKYLSCLWYLNAVILAF